MLATGGGKENNFAITSYSILAGYFLNNIFHEDKGHFATGERALFASSGNMGD
jgi:hypothetical protein